MNGGCVPSRSCGWARPRSTALYLCRWMYICMCMRLTVHRHPHDFICLYVYASIRTLETPLLLRLGQRAPAALLSSWEEIVVSGNPSSHFPSEKSTHRYTQNKKRSSQPPTTPQSILPNTFADKTCLQHSAVPPRPLQQLEEGGGVADPKGLGKGISLYFYAGGVVWCL